MKGQWYSGLFIVVVLAGVGLAGSRFLQFGPREISTAVLEPPGPVHLLGTTDLGEDILAQLVHAILPTFAIGFGTALGCVLVGFLLGAYGAQCGSLTDRIILRSVDIMSAVPPMVAVMLVMSVVRPDIGGLIIILTAFNWHTEVRLFRAWVLTELQRDYINMARTFGGSGHYILVRHLFPGCLPLLTARFLLNTRMAVFKLAGLSFLGLTDPEMISFGSILQQSLPYLTLGGWKHWSLPPALLLLAALSGLTLIGNRMERKSLGDNSE